MRRKFKLSIILIFLLLIFFKRDAKYKDSISTLDTLADLSFVRPPVVLKGVWHYTFPFYSSELTFLEDGTFSFHDQGCMGHSYSEGRWIQNEKYVTLTSFDKYKRKPISFDAQTIVEEDNEVDSQTTFSNDTLSKEHFIFKLHEIKFESLISNTRSSDTMDVYLDKEPYLLQGDTLYKLDKNGDKMNSKFVK